MKKARIPVVEDEAISAMALKGRLMAMAIVWWDSSTLLAFFNWNYL